MAKEKCVSFSSWTMTGPYTKLVYGEGTFKCYVEEIVHDSFLGLTFLCDIHSNVSWSKYLMIGMLQSHCMYESLSCDYSEKIVFT